MKIIKLIVKSQPFDYLILLQNNYIGKSTVIHKRECSDEVGLFDDKNFRNYDNDWEMWIRISEKFGMSYINKPLIKYRLHSDSLLSTRSNKENITHSHIKIIKKTYERWGKPFWMKIQMVRTIRIEKVTVEIIKIKEMLRKVHPVCRKFASVVLITWEVPDKILFYVEKKFYKKIL